MYDARSCASSPSPSRARRYDDLLAVASTAERLGFGAFFRSDHYLAMGGALEAGGLPGPTDAWITLAGLARDTSTIRLGTLVTSATFRLPGPLAVTVAGVDQMSGGRVELGLGAGWYEREHEAYGIPFPPLGERFDRLEEQLEVITGLWSTPVGERFAYDGRDWPVADSPALPKPVQAGGVPIIIGGGGPKRTPGAGRPIRRRVQHAVRCRSSGSSSSASGSGAPARRSAATRRRSRYSAALVACVGADEADVRAAGGGHRAGRRASCASNGVAGTARRGAGDARALAGGRRRTHLPASARSRPTSTTCDAGIHLRRVTWPAIIAAAAYRPIRS